MVHHTANRKLSVFERQPIATGTQGRFPFVLVGTQGTEVDASPSTFKAAFWSLVGLACLQNDGDRRHPSDVCICLLRFVATCDFGTVVVDVREGGIKPRGSQWTHHAVVVVDPHQRSLNLTSRCTAATLQRAQGVLQQVVAIADEEPEQFWSQQKCLGLDSSSPTHFDWEVPKALLAGTCPTPPGLSSPELPPLPVSTDAPSVQPSMPSSPPVANRQPPPPPSGPRVHDSRGPPPPLPLHQLQPQPPPPQQWPSSPQSPPSQQQPKFKARPSQPRAQPWLQPWLPFWLPGLRLAPGSDNWSAAPSRASMLPFVPFKFPPGIELLEALRGRSDGGFPVRCTFNSHPFIMVVPLTANVGERHAIIHISGCDRDPVVTHRSSAPGPAIQTLFPQFVCLFLRCCRRNRQQSSDGDGHGGELPNL